MYYIIYSIMTYPDCTGAYINAVGNTETYPIGYDGYLNYTLGNS